MLPTSPVEYKHPSLKDEVPKLHQATLGALCLISLRLEEAKLHCPVLTEVGRTRAMQTDRYWRAIMKAAGCSEAEAKERARQRFSWHLVYCAFDMRNWCYTAKQLPKVMALIRQACAEQRPLETQSKWEILSHDVGNGSHIHVGYKDLGWARTFKVS
jgi:hypothetical protein